MSKTGVSLENFDPGYLEQQILAQAEKIYKKLDGITVYFLWKTYQNKFEIFQSKFDENDLTGFCERMTSEEKETWNEEKLTHVQHCKCYLKRMLEPIQIEIKHSDIDLLQQIQKTVIRKISQNGIIVETNPTSNTTIGEIDNIFDHYIFNLNQRGLESHFDVTNSLLVSINSDDPSVFNTSISNEFAYIFYALQEKGYAREVALEWIDRIRETGFRSSFIEKRPLNAEERIQEIDKILQYLK